MDLEVTLVSRRPQRVTETPAALAILTGDELRRIGVHSLPDALRLALGFQVGQVDANKWVVASRGFAGLFANKLLVLVDGRSVYTPLVLRRFLGISGRVDGRCRAARDHPRSGG